MLIKKLLRQDAWVRKMWDVFEAYPEACHALMGILNDPPVRRRMKDAGIYFNRPPLAAILKDIEDHPDIKDALEWMRFRQLTGMLINRVMRQEGQEPCGRKVSVGNYSVFFTKTEIFKERE